MDTVEQDRVHSQSPYETRARYVCNENGFDFSYPDVPVRQFKSEHDIATAPGQTGHTSPAASSHTVITKSSRGPPAAANSSQFLLRAPVVGMCCCSRNSSTRGFTAPLG